MGKRFELQIDPDLKKKAENKAKSEGMSLAAWIRHLIIKNL